MSRATRSRHAGIIALAVITAALLSACANSNDAAKDNNAQDVTFAKDMIPHHAQALEMAKLADTRASAPQVKALAKRIEAAQQPEIEQMNGWLASWGEEKVDVSMMGQEHGDHGHSMLGMMSADDMKRLMAEHGSGYDRMFLQMMIEHHKGAIEMAKTETAKGKNIEAKALARSIVTSQQAEITEMEKLLIEIGNQ